MQLMHNGKTQIKISGIIGRSWVEPHVGGKSIMTSGGMTIFASVHHVQKQFIKISLQYTIHHSSKITVQITLGQQPCHLVDIVFLA
jgi:hypothetical protein